MAQSTNQLLDLWTQQVKKVADYDRLLKALRIIAIGSDGHGELTRKGLRMVAAAAIRASTGEVLP